MRTDYTKLIPELPQWNNGDGIDIDSWLGCKGDFQLAIAFSRMFWPNFVEHDDCVLFAEFSTTTYSEFFTSCGGDRAAIEAVMNHQHIVDFFNHAAKDATWEQLIYLGRILKDIFLVKLKHDFPSRQFRVEFDEGPFDELVNYQVTFWQPAHLAGV